MNESCASSNLIEYAGHHIELRDAPKLQDIQRLQVALGLLPQVHIEPKHSFAKGMYGRELLMPAGTLIVGKIHQHEHLAIMVYGDILVYTEQGGKRRLKGYNMMVSPPETKRVVYPFEDTLWITIHLDPDGKRDADALETDMITPDDPGVLENFAQEFLQHMKGTKELPR